MCKSCVAPLKSVSVPRLEVTAAILTVKIWKLNQQEFQYRNLQNEWFLLAKITEANSNNDPEIKEAESC